MLVWCECVPALVLHGDFDVGASQLSKSQNIDPNDGDMHVSACMHMSVPINIVEFY